MVASWLKKKASQFLLVLMKASAIAWWYDPPHTSFIIFALIKVACLSLIANCVQRLIQNGHAINSVLNVVPDNPS